MRESTFQVPESGEAQLVYWCKRSRSPKPPWMVYVIQALGDTPIKVGMAKDVEARIATLQTGNPRPLMLLEVLVGGIELERALHVRLASSRLSGEWFDGPAIPEFLEFVKDLAERMLVAHKGNQQVPDFKRFDPFAAEIREAEESALPSVTQEHFEHKGRLSSASSPENWDKDLEARRFRAAQEEPTFKPHRPS